MKHFGGPFWDTTKSFWGIFWGPFLEGFWVGPAVVAGPTHFFSFLGPKNGPKKGAQDDLDFGPKMDPQNVSFFILVPIQVCFWKGPVLDPFFDRLSMPKGT